MGDADARGLAHSRGASSTTGWLRGTHRLGPGDASRLVKAARVLHEQLPATAEAMSAGEVHLGQVEVIVESLRDLSDQVPPELRADGERTLIEACDSLDPNRAPRINTTQ